jgi:hypothetical protein
MVVSDFHSHLTGSLFSLKKTALYRLFLNLAVVYCTSAIG